MCNSCEIQIDGVWSHLHINQSFVTPDETKGVPFTITSIAAKAIKISPQNVVVTRGAFAAALHYLRANRHDHTNHLKIGSNKDPALAGPLCKVARAQNSNVMCINYILPILAKHNIVDINPNRPNTVWIVRCSKKEAQSSLPADGL